MKLEQISTIHKVYNRFNPVSQCFIRPALEITNAKNNPIKGGLTAAIASGGGHYVLFEAIGQASDFLFGTNFSDPETKMVLTNINPIIHYYVGINMACNLLTGIYLNHLKK